jgi:trehalose/maltose hydrolase-like predicted phosphorylase
VHDYYFVDMRRPILLSIAQLLLSTPSLAEPEQINCAKFGPGYNGTFWHTYPWAITNTQFRQGDFRHRLSLSNGYLGISVSPIGPFFEEEQFEDTRNASWPLYNERSTFATIAGFYGVHTDLPCSNATEDNKRCYNAPWLKHRNESVISGIPHWAGLQVKVNGAVLNASVDSSQIAFGNFTSTLNISEGRLSWDYMWQPDRETSIRVEYSMFLHKLFVNQAAVQLKLTSERDINATVYDVLEGKSPCRTEAAGRGSMDSNCTIWVAVRPVNVDSTAYIYSTIKAQNDDVRNGHARGCVESNVPMSEGKSITQACRIRLKARETFQVDKFIGVASSRDFGSKAAEVAKNASFQGAITGFAKLLESHIEEWSEILTPDSVDRYPYEDASGFNKVDLDFLNITAVTNTFYILQNTIGPNAMSQARNANKSRLGATSIPVCGLGSDCYGGFIMWDAEVFIAPSLQLSHPYSMRQVTRYRLERFKQAKDNVKDSRFSWHNDTAFSDKAAVYPWTSGRSGRCTRNGPCFDYEYHVNGAVAMSLVHEFEVTGDQSHFKEKLFPIYDAIAHLFSEILVYNTTTEEYEVLMATDPDEYAEKIDRPAYTHALISKHLNTTIRLSKWLGIDADSPWEEWSRQASSIRLPMNEKSDIVKEFEGMDGAHEVKQADVILIDDFLHYHRGDSLASLDYYAIKQSLDGPAMTYASFSIVANKLSPSGCSSGMSLSNQAFSALLSSFHCAY